MMNNKSPIRIADIQIGLLAKVIVLSDGTVWGLKPQPKGASSKKDARDCLLIGSTITTQRLQTLGYAAIPREVIAQAQSRN